MICRKTMEECKMPSMCAPFGGCSVDDSSQRVAELNALCDELLNTLNFERGQLSKLREDYEVQGLALKASKAMQLAETKRADALERDRDTARIEGWQAAREQAVNLCHEQWKAHSHEERVDACDDCAGSIRAMQPPADWQCAEVPSVCGAAPNIEGCGCKTCRPITLTDMRMVLCPVCGNKRCPRANDHRNACTGSNEPGQPGSAYPSDWPHPDGFAGGLTERSE